MRKVLNIVTTALLLTGLSVPVASFATESEPDPTIVDIYGYLNEEQELENMHSEIEHGHEDHSGVLIPPVVIRMGQPSDPNIFVLPTDPSGQVHKWDMSPELDTALEKLGLVSQDQKSNLDPYRHAPIPIQSIEQTTKTPADEFMDGARFFGLGLGVAALVLLALTSVSTIRSRRRKKMYLSTSGQ